MSRLPVVSAIKRERNRLDGPTTAIAAEAEQRFLRTELEHLLQAPGCPVCRHVEGAERAFFAWCSMESFTASEVQAQLRASMGMCPRHMRRLVEMAGEGHVMTTVMRHAVLGARTVVHERTAPAPCPACDAASSAVRRGIGIVVDGFSDPAHVRLYAEHGGMCLPHAAEAARRAEPGPLKLIAERLLDSVSDASGRQLVERLAGTDPDAARRARWRERLPAERPAQSTLSGLTARLAVDTCPVCLSTGWIERRYVRWFLERSRERDGSPLTDPGELCAGHLHDVAHTDASIGALAAERKRQARSAELRALLDGLVALRPPDRRGRQPIPEGLDQPRRRFIAGRYCSACHAVDGTERSQLSLLSAALALATVRDDYVRGHGICVHHSLQVHDIESASVIAPPVEARLALLGWELEEAARKTAWGHRHEPTGPERHAWLRAAAQINGRVFEGGEAPVG